METTPLFVPETKPTDSCEALDADLRQLCQRRAQLGRALCRQLVAFEAIGGPARLGFATLREYGEHALGMTAREVRECLRVGRRLEALPLIGAALGGGTLGWSAARALTRVVTHETEAEWLEQAQSVSMRELEAAISICTVGDLPPDRSVRPVAPAVTRFVFELSSTDAQVVTDALAMRRSTLGDDIDVSDVFLDLCRSALTSDAAAVAGQTSTNAAVANGALPTERFQIVLQRCSTCADVVHVGHGPTPHAVPSNVAEQAECDAVVVDLDRGGRVTRAIPPQIRRRVLHRDDRQCVVPGCGARLWVDVHHLVPRAEGGGHHDSNLCVLCPRHHARVHDGTLRVWRENDGHVRVERQAAVRTHAPKSAAPATNAPRVDDELAGAIAQCQAEFGWVAPVGVALHLERPVALETLELELGVIATARGWHRTIRGLYLAAA